MGFSFGFIFAAALLRMAPLFSLPSLLTPSKAVCSESHTAAASDTIPHLSGILKHWALGQRRHVPRVCPSPPAQGRQWRDGGRMSVCLGQESLLLENPSSRDNHRVPM